MGNIEKGLLVTVFSAVALGFYLDWQQQNFVTKEPEHRDIISAAKKAQSCDNLNTAVLYSSGPIAQNKAMFGDAVLLGSTLCDLPTHPINVNR